MFTKYNLDRKDMIEIKERWRLFERLGGFEKDREMKSAAWRMKERLMHLQREKNLNNQSRNSQIKFNFCKSSNFWMVEIYLRPMVP